MGLCANPGRSKRLLARLHHAASRRQALRLVRALRSADEDTRRSDSENGKEDLPQKAGRGACTQRSSRSSTQRPGRAEEAPDRPAATDTIEREAPGRGAGGRNPRGQIRPPRGAPAPRRESMATQSGRRGGRVDRIGSTGDLFSTAAAAHCLTRTGIVGKSTRAPSLLSLLTLSPPSLKIVSPRL